WRRAGSKPSVRRHAHCTTFCHGPVRPPNGWRPRRCAKDVPRRTSSVTVCKTKAKPSSSWRLSALSFMRMALHGLLSNPAYTGNLYVGRTHACPARIRRSATHPLGKPAHSQDATPPETWTFVTNIPALVSQDVFDRVQA